MLTIVEGDGDIGAVRVLVRRVLEKNGLYETSVLGPHKRGELPKVRTRFADFLRAAVLHGAPILWVMDFDCVDCHCPKASAEALYRQAQDIVPNWPIRFCFMVQEFETLFLAERDAAQTVLKDIPRDFAFPDDPEKIRDAKGFLSNAMPKGIAYKPTTHQEKISARLDLETLHANSPSFRHFEKSVLFLARQETPY
jgi:hypothetical protein